MDTRGDKFDREFNLRRNKIIDFEISDIYLCLSRQDSLVFTRWEFETM